DSKLDIAIAPYETYEDEIFAFMIISRLTVYTNQKTGSFESRSEVKKLELRKIEDK
ncbi:unnamed protein product, partial [Brassica oleracea var. botrytis]